MNKALIEKMISEETFEENIQTDLNRLDSDSLLHLEDEFEDYQVKYPLKYPQESSPA